MHRRIALALVFLAAVQVPSARADVCGLWSFVFSPTSPAVRAGAVAAYDPIGHRTILLGGFSKDYAMTGWRIGYACGPSDLIQGLVRIHQYSIMSAPTTAQDAALEALRSGEPYVQEMVTEYDRRRRLLVAGLNRLGLATFEPRGAFYTFPDIRASGMDDETFCQKLLEEEHVAVVPGNSFGPGGEGFARMCYATEYSKIEEALHRMEKFMNRYG